MPQEITLRRLGENGSSVFVMPAGWLALEVSLMSLGRHLLNVADAYLPGSPNPKKSTYQRPRAIDVRERKVTAKNASHETS
jgi:hypothetical protein